MPINLGRAIRHAHRSLRHSVDDQLRGVRRGV